MAVIILPVLETLVYISRIFHITAMRLYSESLRHLAFRRLSVFLRKTSNVLVAKVILIIKRQMLRLKNVSIVSCRFLRF